MYKFTRLASIITIIALSLATILFLVPAQDAKADIAGLPNVYVNATGNDSYTGSSAVFVSGNIGPKKTIAAGIAAVATNGTVNVAAGTYYEHGLHLSSDMNLVGESALTTIIDGGAGGCVLIVSSLPDQRNTISRLTIQNGAAVPLPPTIQNGNGVSDNFGGGIYISSSHIVTINDCAIINNTKMAIAVPQITNNTTRLALGLESSGVGAGICNNGGALYMNGCTVSGNTAAYSGGGIYTTATPLGANIVNSGRPSNSVEAFFGLVDLTNCTISGNAVTGGPPAPTIRRGNIVNGFVDSEGYGGGIYCEANATVRLLNVTVAGNTVNGTNSKGGGFFNGSTDSFYFKNCIVANNTAGSGASNNGFDATVPPTGIHSEGYNIDSENTCYFTQTTDQRNTDPGLGVLQNNGGTTKTHAITVTSPAFNRGTSVAPSWSVLPPVTDQRGVIRPQVAMYDIGAFEMELKSGCIPTANGTGNACFSLSNGSISGLTVAGTMPCGTTIPGYNFPQGFFYYTISGITPGSAVIITITFPVNMPVGTKYFKCINGQWVDVTSLLGDNDGDNVLTLTLTDGGLGDADGIVNGVIVDPGGPAVPVVAASTRRGDDVSSSQMPEKIMTSSARMSVKYLNVQPQQAQANQQITVYANIANGGDEAGNYSATLKINGAIEETRTGKVGAHAAVPLQFVVSKDKPGIYNVDINGQQASFVIVDDGGTKHNLPTRYWAMVGFFLSAIGVIVVLALLLRRRLAEN